MSCAAGIKFVSPVNGTGYGTAGRRVLLALRDAGVPFTWTPMVPGGGWDLAYEPFSGTTFGDPELDPFCNRALDYDTVVVHLVPEYLLRWRLAEPAKRLVAATVWETDRLPAHWPFFLEQADLVLVPCEWNRRLFAGAGLRVPVAFSPFPAVHPAPGKGGAASLPWSVPDEHFVFYAIEAWSARKGLAELVRCYLDTFTARDAVTLIVKTSRDDTTCARTLGGFHRTDAVVRRLRRGRREPAAVVVVSGDVSAAAIDDLHTRGDCYVSLTRGEGFGLGIFDAAWRGKPVVTTAHGAPAEYLPEGVAWLVKARLVPVDDPVGRPSFARDQRWAVADPVHASALLRYAFEHRAEGVARGARLREAMRRRFDERKIVERFVALVGGSVPA